MPGIFFSASVHSSCTCMRVRSSSLRGAFEVCALLQQKQAMAECDMPPAGQRKLVAIGANNRRDQRSRAGLAMRKKKNEKKIVLTCCDAALRCALYRCTRTHSPLPLTNLSPPIHFPLLRYSLPPLHLVCARPRHPPALPVSTPTPFLHIRSAWSVLHARRC